MGLDITFTKPNHEHVADFRSFHQLNQHMKYSVDRKLSPDDVIKLIVWCAKLDIHPAVKADYIRTFATVLSEFDCPYMNYHASW